jgi:hypothetical protein
MIEGTSMKNHQVAKFDVWDKGCVGKSYQQNNFVPFLDPALSHYTETWAPKQLFHLQHLLCIQGFAIELGPTTPFMEIVNSPAITSKYSSLHIHMTIASVASI